jgi:hypothetical protein
LEARGGTIDRLDIKAVLGEEQCVPADAATEVEHMLRAACLQHRNQRGHAGCGTSQSSRPSGVAHRSSHASTAVAAICASLSCRPLLWPSS